MQFQGIFAEQVFIFFQVTRTVTGSQYYCHQEQKRYLAGVSVRGFAAIHESVIVN
jgi:hypothetical protein